MFSLWRKARRENSAASRLLGSTSLRFALHGWQRQLPELAAYAKELGMRVNLITNGTRINAGLAQRLADAGLDS
ncbi:hypothetical protein, partial [Thiolapillus sp.]|uniref:hypothetical protein n=1 Tax=Thiolapillus sp. TaxID=2017437 RepID=UPI003AF78FD4